MAKEKSKSKILVVENNSNYIASAKKYFTSLPDVGAEFIIDYENASRALPNYDGKGGALIDIFIPENERERLGKVGKELLGQFRNELEERKKYCLVETARGEKKPVYWGLLRLLRDKDKELYGSLHDYAESKRLKITDEDFLKLPMVKNALDNFKGCFPEYWQRKEQLDRELEALAKEEAIGHSPLGIELMKQAQELGIPACFVTDGDHHGQIYGAIRSVFFDGKMPPTKFGYGNKDIKFWQDAYEMLKEKK